MDFNLKAASQKWSFSHRIPSKTQVQAGLAGALYLMNSVDLFGLAQMEDDKTGLIHLRGFRLLMLFTADEQMLRTIHFFIVTVKPTVRDFLSARGVNYRSRKE